MVLYFSNLITLFYKVKITNSQHSMVIKFGSIKITHFITNLFKLQS